MRWWFQRRQQLESPHSQHTQNLRNLKTPSSENNTGIYNVVYIGLPKIKVYIQEFKKKKPFLAHCAAVLYAWTNDISRVMILNCFTLREILCFILDNALECVQKKNRWIIVFFLFIFFCKLNINFHGKKLTHVWFGLRSRGCSLVLIIDGFRNSWFTTYNKKLLTYF